MTINELKNKIEKILNGLIKIVNNPNDFVKNNKQNEFVQKKVSEGNPVNPKVRRRRANRLPKQTYSYKGSGYNGKGSVNTDASIFRKSRG